MDMVLTNTWYDAFLHKPWDGREVLCRFSDNRFHVCSWGGYYWRDQEGHRVVETVVQYVTHFFIYERPVDGGFVDE